MEAYWSEADRDVSNGRAALAYAVETADGQLGHRLAVGIGISWEHHGLLDEGRGWLEKVLALSGEIDAEIRFESLHNAANLAWMQHDFAAAHAYVLQAVNECDPEDTARVAALFNLQARVFLEEGRLQDADRVLVKAIALARSCNDLAAAGFIKVQRGEVAFGLGDMERCEELTRTGLAQLTEDNYIPFCIGWTNLAEVALSRGDVTSAAAALRRVVGKAHLHTRRERIFLVAVASFLLLDLPAGGGQGTDARAATATRLLAYVTAASERLGQLSPVTQRLIVERMERSRRCLSAEAWQKAWDSGRTLTAKDAFAVAEQQLSVVWSQER